MKKNTLAVRQARDQLGRLIDAAHYAGDITIITRQGEEWAAIVPLSIVRQYSEQSSRPV